MLNRSTLVPSKPSSLSYERIPQMTEYKPVTPQRQPKFAGIKTDTNDQYFDRPYYHGSMFRRAVEENIILTANSIQVGIRGPVYAKDAYDESRSLGFKVVTMSAVREMGLQRLIEIIKDRVGPSRAFVTFDIDVVDPAYAPGTGTPEVGRFTSAEAIDLIQGLKGLNYVGFDVVEVLPDYDVAEITALLAANIIYEFLSLIAINKTMSVVLRR